MHDTSIKEKALLVMVEIGREPWPQDVLAEEFKHLVRSCGIEIAEFIHVKRHALSPRLFIGKGKAEELIALIQEKNISVVIFNNDLRFSQQRNLEEAFGIKTIDRTQLILDIFARHAKSQEGILQVDLAQLKYLLPRLKGQGIMLSRLGGGIGTRGPGEKKLEIDRRKITERIFRLEGEINQISQHREVLRKKRKKENIKICSLVGYTSAGKTTLFNSLTESQEKTSSDLFTTLDPITRTFTVSNNQKMVISDTVGFIYKLPENLMNAFRATLEELSYADVILHIIDATSKDIARLMESVNTVIKELELGNKPIITIFNKIDKLSEIELETSQVRYPEGIFISALNKINLEKLKEEIYAAAFSANVKLQIIFPFSLMDLVGYIHKNCEVLEKKYNQEKVIYTVRADKSKIAYLEKRGAVIKEVN